MPQEKLQGSAVEARQPPEPEAGRALMETELSAEDVARRAMAIASDICVYTNGNLTVETIRP